MKKIETLRQLQLVGIYIYKDLLKTASSCICWAAR